MPNSTLPHAAENEARPGAFPATEDFQTVSMLFKQLSDASRLRIFWLLCHCEATGTELAGMMNMSTPAVAHHLRLLRSDKLLVSRRNGKEVCYRAADTAQAQALHHMIEEMIEISCPQEGPNV